MNTVKFPDRMKKKPQKPPEEQRWEGEGGHPPVKPVDTPKPGPAFADFSFPGPQITRILRDLLGRLPKPQDSSK
jgi:hypothetical protein